MRRIATEAMIPAARNRRVRNIRRGSDEASVSRRPPGGPDARARVGIDESVRSAADMIIGADGRCPDSVRIRSARNSAAL